MLSFLNRARKKRANGEAGFTLIELLVVVVILGILIAIAIPVYLNYKKSANDKAAQSDLRNAVSTLEVCNSDLGYPGTMDSAGTMGGTPLCASQTINLSTGTTLFYKGNAATNPTAYVIESRNSGGSGTGGKVYCYSSAGGGSVTGTAATAFLAAYAATCPS